MLAKLPGAQRAHTVLPEALAKVPGAHATHDVPPPSNDPAAHAWRY